MAAEGEGLTWARWGGVPRIGTGEFSVPFAGIVRPFSFSCGKFEAAFSGAELHAVHYVCVRAFVRISGRIMTKRAAMSITA